MARNLTTNATVVIAMNGKQANETMQKLAKSAENLDAKIKKAKAAGDTVTVAKLEADLKKVNSQLKLFRTNTVQLEDTLRDLDKAKLTDLQQALANLKYKLKDLERGSEMWKAHVRNLHRVQEEINRVNAELRTQQTLIDRVNGWWGKLQNVILGVVAAVTGLIAAGRNAVGAFAEMDESMANTRKFTGLSVEGVNKLNESFKKLDTRTARKKLNDYAQEAGRLGKSTQESVTDYVKAADIINVALSDLGEGATQKIAKLANIFKLEDLYGTYDSMLKIGSVVNVLSQNCTASKPYLVEFASRLAGVGNQAHISLQNIIGFGAVLDANAQKVEASATAISQVLTRMYRDPAKYAKVAGLDIKQFSNLLKKDANEALLQFLETLGKAGNMDVLAPMFADMGENGARVINALSTLSKHIDEVRWQQDNANEAFRKGTSVLREFNIFNNTAQAGIDKAKARVAEIAIELGEKLYPIMKHIYTSSSLFLRVLSIIVTFLINNHRAIISLTTAIVAYNVAVNAALIKEKAMLAIQVMKTAVMKAYRTAVALATLAQAIYTNNTMQAALAMKALNSAVASNPLGLLVAALTAVASYLVMTRKESDKFKESVDKAAASSVDFSKAMNDEIKEIDKLFGALDGATKGTEEYDKAKNKIISKYKVYLSGLINERGEITNLTAAYNRLTWAAEKSARARGIANAKQGVEDAYFNDTTQNLDKLRESLTKMGMPVRQLTDIMTRISSMIGAGEDLDGKTNEKWKNIINEVFSFQKNSSRLKKMQVDELPVTILGAMMSHKMTHDSKMQDLDAMEDKTFTKIPDKNLQEIVKSLSEQVLATPNQVITIALPAGSKEGAQEMIEHIIHGVEYDKSEIQVDYKGFPLQDATSLSVSLSRNLAENLLKQLAWEQGQRGSDNMQESSSDDIPLGGSYTPQGKADKEAKKQATEARRAAAKAKKEFREGLEAIKAARIKADEETTAAYVNGDIDQMQFVEKKHDNEVKYFDDSIKFYRDYFSKIKDSYIEDDKDYQTLVSKKQEAEIKYQEKIISVKSKNIDREVKKLQEEENLIYAKIKEPSLRDQLDHEDRLAEIKADGLRRQRDLYVKGSKEWLEINQTLADGLQDQEAKLYASLYSKLNNFRKEFDKASPVDKFRMEIEVLEILRNNINLTAGEYEKLKKAISQKYEKELPGADRPKSAKELKESRDKKRRKDNEEIDKAVSEGVISKDEGEKRKRFLDNSEFDSIISKIKGVGGAWSDLCLDMVSAWRDLFSGLGDEADGGLGKIANAAQATFALLNAGFQTAAEFAAEESKIAQQQITDRYDHEIQLAQGNAYLVKKLEKEKEEKIAAEKNKASQKEFKMKIFSAVAQTAENALSGYGAGLKAPFPMSLWLAPMLAGLAVAQGAVQVALITKQQQAASAQGYSEGGFTKPGDVDEVAGVVHAGEWVASQRLLASPVARPIINFLDQAQRSNTIGSLTKQDASRIVATGAASLNASKTPEPVVVQVQQQQQEIAGLVDVVKRLSDRLERPFVTVNTMTGDHGIKQAEDEYKRYIANKNKYMR